MANKKTTTKTETLLQFFNLGLERRRSVRQPKPGRRGGNIAVVG